MLPQFVNKWEQGAEIVVAVKKTSKESALMFAFRKFYYMLLDRFSDVSIIRNFTGFGLYDKKVMNALKRLDDPCPFFR